MLYDPGCNSWQGREISLFYETSRAALGPTQPPIDGNRVSLPRIKREGSEVGHSPLSSAEVKNEWSCNSTLPCLHDMHRSNFTLSPVTRICGAVTTTTPSTPQTAALFNNVTSVQRRKTKRLPLRNRNRLSKRIKNVNKWRNCYQSVHGSFTLAAGTAQRSVFLCAGNRTT
jgi:hypothetical protein